MCGISGVSLDPNDTTLNVAEVSAELLRGIASRGPDATGAAWYDKDKDAVQLTKIAVPVAKFLDARLDILPKTTPVMILHTRMGTVGSKENRLNNHPIHYGTIVGVHNGCLWDHKGMFKEMGKEPRAEVDSEAIMALLDGAKAPEKVMRKIAGDAALAWINLEAPETLHLARVVDRPLYIAQTEGGSLLFASTKAAVQAAASKNGLKLVYELDVPEAKYLRVLDGKILDYLDIPGVTKNRAWSRKYAYTSGDDWGYGGYNATKTTTSGPKAKDTVTVADTYLQQLRGKTIEQLAAIAASSVSARIELDTRGYNPSGERVRLLTVPELAKLVKEKNHPWARVQLSLRHRNAQGELFQGTQPTLEELITKAAGGDANAIAKLDARGYDRTGAWNVKPAPVSAAVE